jgi:hypothetical protein
VGDRTGSFVRDVVLFLERSQLFLALGNVGSFGRGSVLTCGHMIKHWNTTGAASAMMMMSAVCAC